MIGVSTAVFAIIALTVSAVVIPDGSSADQVVPDDVPGFRTWHHGTPGSVHTVTGNQHVVHVPPSAADGSDATSPAGVVLSWGEYYSSWYRLQLHDAASGRVLWRVDNNTYPGHVVDAWVPPSSMALPESERFFLAMTVTGMQARSLANGSRILWTDTLPTAVCQVNSTNSYPCIQNFLYNATSGETMRPGNVLKRSHKNAESAGIATIFGITRSRIYVFKVSPKGELLGRSEVQVLSNTNLTWAPSNAVLYSEGLFLIQNNNTDSFGSQSLFRFDAVSGKQLWSTNLGFNNVYPQYKKQTAIIECANASTKLRRGRCIFFREKQFNLEIGEQLPDLPNPAEYNPTWVSAWWSTPNGAPSVVVVAGAHVFLVDVNSMQIKHDVSAYNPNYNLELSGVAFEEVELNGNLTTCLFVVSGGQSATTVSAVRLDTFAFGAQSNSLPGFTGVPIGWWVVGETLMVVTNPATSLCFGLSLKNLSTMFEYSAYNSWQAATAVAVTDTNSGVTSLTLFGIAKPLAVRRVDFAPGPISQQKWYGLDFAPFNMAPMPPHTDPASPDLLLQWNNGVSALPVQSGGKLSWTVPLPQQVSTDIALPLGTQYVVATSYQGLLVILDASTGNNISTTKGISMGNYGPAVASADGAKYMLVISKGQYTTVFRIATDDATVTPYNNLFGNVNFYPNQGTLAPQGTKNENFAVLEFYGSNYKNRTIAVFDVANNMTLRWSRPSTYGGITQTFSTRCTFSSDGELLLHLEEGGVVVALDVRSGHIVWKTPINTSTAIANLKVYSGKNSGVHPNRLFVFTGSNNGGDDSSPFYCLSSNTGAKLYNSTWFMADGTIPTPINSEGKLIVQNVQTSQYLIDSANGNVTSLPTIAPWSTCQQVQVYDAKYIVAVCSTRLMVGAWPEWQQLVMGTSGSQYNFQGYWVDPSSLLPSSKNLRIFYVNQKLLQGGSKPVGSGMFAFEKAYLERRRQELPKKP